MERCIDTYFSGTKIRALYSTGDDFLADFFSGQGVKPGRERGVIFLNFEKEKKDEPF